MASTSLSAYKASPEEGARNRERIETLAKLPENAICADCPLHGPRWLTINIGAFICLPCSGIHRNLGVHISKVRSVNMDALNDDWLDHMAAWGNKRVNEEWQAELPAGYQLPTATDADNQTPVLDRFIRDKYERQLFRKGAGAAAAAAAAARAAGAGGGDGWGEHSDWEEHDAQPGEPRPAEPAAPPKIESGAYSTGTMKGFGNPHFEAQPEGSWAGGSGLFSGALSGLWGVTQNVTSQVVSSAAPLVQRSVESTRPLVSNLGTNLAAYSGGALSVVQDAVSFDVGRDLAHLRVRDGEPEDAGGAGFAGFGGFGSDEADAGASGAADGDGSGRGLRGADEGSGHWGGMGLDGNGRQPANGDSSHHRQRNPSPPVAISKVDSNSSTGSRSLHARRTTGAGAAATTSAAERAAPPPPAPKVASDDDNDSFDEW